MHSTPANRRTAERITHPEQTQLSKLTKTEAKRLERIQILRTLKNYGPMSAVDLVERANNECDHTALEALPDLTRMGITGKLRGLWHRNWVVGEWPGGGQPMVWSLTDTGREEADRV